MEKCKKKIQKVIGGKTSHCNYKYLRDLLGLTEYDLYSTVNLEESIVYQ